MEQHVLDATVAASTRVAISADVSFAAPPQTTTSGAIVAARSRLRQSRHPSQLRMAQCRGQLHLPILGRAMCVHLRPVVAPAADVAVAAATAAVAVPALAASLALISATHTFAPTIIAATITIANFTHATHTVPAPSHGAASLASNTCTTAFAASAALATTAVVAAVVVAIVAAIIADSLATTSTSAVITTFIAASSSAAAAAPAALTASIGPTAPVARHLLPIDRHLRRLTRNRKAEAERQRCARQSARRNPGSHARPRRRGRHHVAASSERDN
mmetsp:Transcript_24067/g.64555  ORF Transcript_24067/g.64555 Transcript_24067/m.64555 type:complete len:275 (-) Transcript_24067:466-1290(-)